jgi:hypothetical protein
MLPVYAAGVIVLVGWVSAGRLLADIDNRTVAALLDPFGSVALGVLTRYWSPAEKNTQLIPLAEEVLWNRLAWLAVGLAALAFVFARFRMPYHLAERRSRRKERTAPAATATAQPVALPRTTPDTRAAAYLRQLPGLTALQLRETLKSVYFLSIVGAGALFILANSRVLGTLYGTNTYPVTYKVIEFASGSFGLFVIVVVTLYAGELVWRERDARMALIADSTPMPAWLPFLSKLAALFATLAVVQLVVMACGILVQLFNGYTKLELGQYLYSLFALQLPDYWMLAALALTLHVLVNNKYLGHFLVVLVFILLISAEGYGYNDKLYLFGETGRATYSDMNGYGGFVGPKRWFQLYWGAASVILLTLALLFWVRGTDTVARVRMRIARQRLAPSHVVVLALAAIAFVGTGAWIFYNTHVLDAYHTEFGAESLRAEYERRFKAAYGSKPQPKVTAVRVRADIFPREARVAFKAAFTMVNKADAPIPELYLNVSEDARSFRVASSRPMKLVEDVPELGWKRYAFEQPVAPGDTFTLDFDIEYPRPGFTNNGPHMIVVGNGTFINSTRLPAIGYQPNVELATERLRKKHGLPPRPRMPDLDDASQKQRNYLTAEGDWIAFEATVGTDADQIARAPGYLEREWTVNGRRYFRYRMDVPILDFYAFLSARYAVKRDVWHGDRGDVPVEVYYQPGHEYNLDAMIGSVKDSLDYYSRRFSPYQHRQFRILEFPRYASFAQAFPNTIPYSEAIGFIAKVRADDPKDIDYPYYVTAHEAAHQWWAHQVIGANVQGATMLSETLAQYSALMVMKRKYGDAKMKRFLKYELDGYLRGRAIEREHELPLYRNENQQYIHYQKGSLAMYALQDAIGEAAVDRALAEFLRKWAYKGPPYPTSRELLAEFRAVAPAESQALIGDLFETITFWDDRAVAATYREKGAGRYEVTLKVMAKKDRVDAEGRQAEVPMDDLVDIGVYGANDKALYLRKHRVRTGESTVVVEVAELPLRAGIDPVNKLIDRRPDDNVIAVSMAP